MKVNADNLVTAVSKTLAPAYLICGDEPLLVDEAADAIRKRAKQDGFLERERHIAERGFDWDGLGAGGANMSLFASRKLVELRLPTGKPGTAGGKAIVEFAAKLDDDTRLIVFAPKLDKRSMGTAWVKALDAAGVIVQIWPIDAQRLPGWIEQRMRARGLVPQGDAISILVDRVQGNLLAADQELEKLLLQNGAGPVDAQAVSRAVADSARFDIFELADTALAGNVAHAVRVLDGLRSEGVEPTLVLWSLTRELRTLCNILFAVNVERVSLDRAMQAAYVWSSKKAAIGAAARRVQRVSQAYAMLDQAARCDAVIKGLRQGTPWHELTMLVLALAGANTGLKMAV